MNGWIKLHRKIEKHWIWQRPDFLRAWIYIIIRCNHETNNVLIGSHLETVERGEFITSISKFSRAIGLSPKQVRNFFTMLENDSMAVIVGESKWTKISVINYDTYQEIGQTKGTERANKGQTKGNRQE